MDYELLEAVIRKLKAEIRGLTFVCEQQGEAIDNLREEVEKLKEALKGGL